MPETKSYPKNSAGKAITTRVPIFQKNTTTEKIVKEITENAKNYSSINYIYITDEEKKLIGTLSIKNLFSLAPKRKNEPIYKLLQSQTLITIHPYSDQEKAAQLAVKHNIKAIPVVNKNGTFLGIVDNDHILSIMHKEKVEDLLKFAGLPEEENNLRNFLSVPLLASLEQRLPWLILGLISGLLVSQLIGAFEHVLSNTLLIAAFIPVMVYMSNAVGQQATAHLIRDSALSDNIPYFKYFIKQLTAILFIGLIMSLILFIFTSCLYTDLNLALALSLSMLGTITSSIITGFLIPYVFIQLKQDPANSSGPIGTAIQDFLSILIYFLIISLIL